MFESESYEQPFQNTQYSNKTTNQQHFVIAVNMTENKLGLLTYNNMNTLSNVKSLIFFFDKTKSQYFIKKHKIKDRKTATENIRKIDLKKKKLLSKKRYIYIYQPDSKS